MNATQIPVSEFKASCTKILREVASGRKQIEVTNHGRVVAVVSPPKRLARSMKEFAGSLRGTVTYRKGWDAPMGTKDWDACR